jgi:hypothetical protein
MNPEHANDALRQIMSSLRTLAGSDRVFEAWLDQIPSDVRRLMIAKLRADEPDQKEGRDRWTTSELADVLENSITD